jgi:hypothetical protein
MYRKTLYTVYPCCLQEEVYTCIYTKNYPFAQAEIGMKNTNLNIESSQAIPNNQKLPPDKIKILLRTNRMRVTFPQDNEALL